jgi:hypothetical protein
MTVRKIDLPSNGDVLRVETGAVQFGDDWPGLFVRGDQALHLAWCIAELEPHIQALLEKLPASTPGNYDHDHLDMALSTLSAIRRRIYEEVRV